MAASDLEQLELELINDARLNPLGDAARYITSYSPLTASQANIQSNLNFFGVNGAALLSAFSALTPVQPLAWNDNIAVAARTHDNAMIAANQQSHQLPGEANFSQRMINAGYNWTGSAGENVFSAAQDPLQAQAGFMVDWGGPDNGMQSPPGHRTNIMGASYREIGIGIVQTPVQSNVGPLVITEDFGSRGSNGIFVLGVAYNDSDHNNFYSVGEGLGTLTVAIGAANATSAASGGYTVQTNATGVQAITFTGAGLAGAVTFTTTLVNGENAKLDIINGNTLHTSVSGTASGPITTVQGLGLSGLTLTTGAGTQTLIGTSGNDTLNGGADNDTLDGAGGIDTAVYSGATNQYTITRSGSAIAVADSFSNRDGADALNNIEHIQFTDRSMNTTMTAEAAKISTTQISSLVELYVAYFNRVPEASGLAYWIDKVATGETLTQVSQEFYAAGVQFSSVTGYSATMTNAAFIQIVYSNVLGRTGSTAPNASEISYWDNQISTGATTKEGLIQRMLSDAHSFAGDPTWGWVNTLLNNKITVGNTHAVQLGFDYNTSTDAITQTVTIAHAVTPTDTTAAINLIGLSNVHLEVVPVV